MVNPVLVGYRIVVVVAPVALQLRMTDWPFQMVPHPSGLIIQEGIGRIFGALFQKTISDEYAGTLLGKVIVQLFVLTYCQQRAPDGHDREVVLAPVFTNKYVSLVLGLSTPVLV